MKKIFLVLLFSSFQILSCTSKTEVTINPTINFDETEFVNVFRCERLPRECYDTKNVPIIDYNGDKKISPCFKLIETLDRKQSGQLISILNSKRSYASYSYYAFTTDYAIILYNRNKKIIGTVNFSFICSNLNSYPEIAVQNSFLVKKNENIGLSEWGKRNLLRILKISVSKS